MIGLFVGALVGIIFTVETSEPRNVLDRFCTHQNANMDYGGVDTGVELTDEGRLLVTCQSNGDAGPITSTYEIKTEYAEKDGDSGGR